MLQAEAMGRALQHVREEKRQSQELMSALAGIGRTHLSAIERGQRKPTMDTFFKLAEALDMKPSALLARIEEELESE